MGYYKHKRIISQTENNLWVYDGMNPEYLVDIMSPQYTPGYLLFVNFVFAWFLPCLIGGIVAHIAYNNLRRPYFSKVVKNENNEVRKFLLKVRNENTFKNFKNPLGHMHTYENEGWVGAPPTYIHSQYNL
jgi:hypothetical protein